MLLNPFFAEYSFHCTLQKMLFTSTAFYKWLAFTRDEQKDDRRSSCCG